MFAMMRIALKLSRRKGASPKHSEKCSDGAAQYNLERLLEPFAGDLWLK
jgi:hypothetical protein